MKHALENIYRGHRHSVLCVCWAELSELSWKLFRSSHEKSVSLGTGLQFWCLLSRDMGKVVTSESEQSLVSKKVLQAGVCLPKMEVRDRSHCRHCAIIFLLHTPQEQKQMEKHLGSHMMSCAKLQLWKDLESSRLHGKFENYNTEAIYKIRYTQGIARGIRKHFE